MSLIDTGISTLSILVRKIDEPDTPYFFWSRKNREKQIVCARIKKEMINIPVILLQSDNGQDEIWWLTELKKYFEVAGYNAYVISSKLESVLYDLEYIPCDTDQEVKNHICDLCIGRHIIISQI